VLHINNLTYRIEGRLLLDNATIALPAGHKIGLVGRNGSGKTTLLRLIQGEISPDAGTLAIPKGRRLGALAQEAPSGPASLIEIVLEADQERHALMAESETAEDPARIADIQNRLADIDAHRAPARAAAILAGLGFDEAAQQRPVSSYSGGWRMRVALAAVLFSKPDILLLDEPTNYLDLEGTLWLENYLKNYPYTVLLVSHDRDLLNKAVNRILHLEHNRLTLYTGGYDTFEKTRRMQLDQQLALKSKQDEARRHMQAFVDRFRYKATKARQAQSRLKALEKMRPIAAVTENRMHPFHFPNPVPMPPPLIRLENASVGYEPGKPVLQNLNLRIDMEDRIALLGANGNGKSTFAKLLSKRLKPLDGKLLSSKKLDIAYFAQHQLDEMMPQQTPFTHVQDLMPDATQAQVRGRLGSFGFDYDRANTKVKNLSGGEKARLLLHLCTLKGPHVLILDEPTNHLDVDSREALIHAINDYTGCVILISHDRHLLETCADRLWIVTHGTVKPFEGDLDDYRDELLAAARAGRRTNRAGGPGTNKGARQQARKRAADRRAALNNLKKQAAAAEKALQALEKELQSVDAALAAPGLFDKAPSKAADLSRQRAGIVSLTEKAEEAWLEAHAVYEEARADSAG